MMNNKVCMSLDAVTNEIKAFEKKNSLIRVLVIWEDSIVKDGLNHNEFYFTNWTDAYIKADELEKEYANVTHSVYFDRVKMG